MGDEQVETKIPDLGAATQEVRRVPLGPGRCLALVVRPAELTAPESIGQTVCSAARIRSKPPARSTSGPRSIGLLDANYGRLPGPDELGR